MLIYYPLAIVPHQRFGVQTVFSHTPFNGLITDFRLYCPQRRNVTDCYWGYKTKRTWKSECYSVYRNLFSVRTWD